MSRTKNFLAEQSEQLTAYERDLLEAMRDMMADSEVMETFDTSVWLKVDAELYDEVLELLGRV